MANRPCLEASTGRLSAHSSLVLQVKDSLLSPPGDSSGVGKVPCDTLFKNSEKALIKSRTGKNIPKQGNKLSIGGVIS